MAGSGSAVLKRSDADYGQFVASRGADNETPVQAAQRETQEEAGITGELLQLDFQRSKIREARPRTIQDGCPHLRGPGLAGIRAMAKASASES